MSFIGRETQPIKQFTYFKMYIVTPDTQFKKKTELKFKQKKKREKEEELSKKFLK